MSHTERFRTQQSRTERSQPAFVGRMTTVGILAGGLLLSPAARARLLPAPSSPAIPAAIPRVVANTYYYSAMILRIPGLYQQGEAYAISKDGAGAAVVGRMWDTGAYGYGKAARYDPPYSLHPYPLVGPNPYVDSLAYATTGSISGTKHAGVATFRSHPNDPNETATAHAFLWNDSNQSYVDLHPAGFAASWAYGAAGMTQVGSVAAPGGDNETAARWSGTAASFTDRHPPGMGFKWSVIRATDGVFHTGYAEFPDWNPARAILWQEVGTSFSVKSLHPTGPVPSLLGPQQFRQSWAYALDSGQQVGEGEVLNAQIPYLDHHALIWDGTSDSARDLHPSDPAYSYSCARGIAHNVAAGYGSYHGSPHALAWHGVQAQNLFDLHTVLPSGYVESMAYSVGVYGDIVGYALLGRGPSGQAEKRPVRWMYRPKVTKPPYEMGPRETSFPASRRRGEGFIITEVRMPKEGGIVRMTSSAPSIVSVPDTVAIGGEEDAALFLMSFAKEGAYPKGTLKSVTLRATYNGVTREAIVNVLF